MGSAVVDGSTKIARGVDISMTMLTTAQSEYLAGQRLGRIATAGADGKPHVVPTSFRHNSQLGTIDVGGLHVATTKKYRDVQANPWAAIVIDDLVSTDPGRSTRPWRHRRHQWGTEGPRHRPVRPAQTHVVGGR